MKRRPVLAAALLASLLAPAHASAAIFTVTTTSEGTTCNLTSCTLRGALTAAQSNGATEDDTIIVPAGTYGVAGPLTLTGNAPTRITIAGAGANTTIIRPVDGGRVLVASPSSQLALRDVTLRDGTGGASPGGNVLVQASASLTLMRVRLTNGVAPGGGGLAAQAATALDISASVIDGNTATGTSGDGGGIYVDSQTNATRVTIQDSTITGNGAAHGGGIAMVNGGTQTPTLRGVTLAFNTAREGGTGGIGGFQSAHTGARIQGSIIAGNTTRINFGPAPVIVPANCAFASAATDEGGNVESEQDCGLPAAGRQNTNPQLATTLDLTAQPPVLPIPATSPAVDLAECGMRTVDQRGVPRPQGLRCDAGAYEYLPPPPPEPTPTPVATTSPTPTPTVTTTQTPTPVVNKTVVVRKVSGRVRVRERGSSRFVDLGAADSIPVGSTVDTKRGVVELKSVPRAGAPVETARFFDGIFRVTQSRGITDLRLTEQLAPCSRRARAAARKPKSRKLWGSGRGAFRTSGNYSAATVRGTRWLVQDSCAGTLTRVTEGTVSVRDKVKKRTILVRAGKRYLAKPKR